MRGQDVLKQLDAEVHAGGREISEEDRLARYLAWSSRVSVQRQHARRRTVVVGMGIVAIVSVAGTLLLDGWRARAREHAAMREAPVAVRTVPLAPEPVLTGNSEQVAAPVSPLPSPAVIERPASAMPRRDESRPVPAEPARVAKPVELPGREARPRLDLPPRPSGPPRRPERSPTEPAAAPRLPALAAEDPGRIDDMTALPAFTPSAVPPLTPDVVAKRLTLPEPETVSPPTPEEISSRTSEADRRRPSETQAPRMPEPTPSPPAVAPDAPDPAASPDPAAVAPSATSGSIRSSMATRVLDRLRDVMPLTPAEERRLERVKEFVAQLPETPIGRALESWIKRPPPPPKGGSPARGQRP
jgi:hypothetical protein